MSLPCPTCLPLDCVSVADEDLYSIESGLFPFVLNCPPGFDCNGPGTFSIVCCGSVLSTIFPPNATIDDRTVLIQEVLNQCAVRNTFCGTSDIPHNPPDQPIQLYYNNPKTCTVDCPDGSPFTYTIPAGAFAGDSQAIVDQQAQDAACIRANQLKVCLGNLSGCLCVGSPYSYRLTTTGGIGPFAWSIWSGSLPTGLAIDQTGTISGTPTASGNFSFMVQVTEPDGSYMRKSYTISVISIVDSSLPDYTVGTPYSHQLAISGGSGNYAVKLDSGTFPDGIVMDVTGLIHGIPTGINAGTMPLVFDVIDTTCTAINRSFFVPRVSITGHSTTTIATVLGYPEYISSTPPKKYHRITWTGESEQIAVALNGGQKVAHAKYVYSGVGEIDGHGVQTSQYRKDLYVPCPSSNFLPIVNSTPNFGLNVLKGYCWPTDPNTCPVCQEPPVFKQDESANYIFDIPQQILDANQINTTSTTLVCNSGAGVVVSVLVGGPGGVNGVPQTIQNGLFGAWLQLTSGSNYGATLSDEYTDAEALANAAIINSNGLTAESIPRTTGFVSRFTTVSYDLNLSNLVIGESYLVQVGLLRQNPNSTGLKSYGVVATATTMTIHDTISTPTDGGTITVRNPIVSFLP